MPRILYIILTLSAMWFWGYALLLDGPQGAHGDLEFFLGAGLALSSYFVGAHALFSILRKKYSIRSRVVCFFISAIGGLVTFVIIIVGSYAFSYALKPVYCHIRPVSPSAPFFRHCDR